MKRRNSWCLLLCAPLAAGCFQEIDSGASRVTEETPPPDPNAEPTTVLETPPIGLDIDDEEVTTRDPCEKTAQDAHQILDAYCGGCHDQGEASSGVPRFDFVMNDEALLRETWTVGAEERKFVV